MKCTPVEVFAPVRNSTLMRRRSLKKVAAPASRRIAGRRVVTHKVTKAELAIRKEVARAFMSIRGMHIDDVFPPSGQDPSLIPCSRTRSPETSRINRPNGGGRKKMARKPRTAGARRATRPVPLDEAAIREEVRKAFMSIRGMHIEDVFPPSDADEQVRT